VFANLATYPKLVGGVGPESTRRAAVFYDSVLDAEIVAMSGAEAAEFSKLADTTYRDVNIALANEFARFADRAGVDIQEVIAAANSQPYSHIHQPGIGVGGHCIPVYPHLLLSRAPDLEVVATSRRTNDGVLNSVIKTIESQLGGLDDAPILVLGLTYRENVKELAYSRALPLIDRLGFHGAEVWGYDPLLSDEEIERNCAKPYHWGESAPFRAIVTQTGTSCGSPWTSRSSPRSKCSSTGGTACARSTSRRRSATSGSGFRPPRGVEPPLPLSGRQSCASSASSEPDRS